MSATDALVEVLRSAAEKGVRDAIGENGAIGRRLMSIDEAATYTNSCRREVLNMIARSEIPVVRHGKRRKLDIRDLDKWIERSKGVA